MKRKIIGIVFCLIALIIVFLSVGEHEDNSLNESLSKIGLKRSIDKQVEKESTVGFWNRLNYPKIYDKLGSRSKNVREYAFNYIGLAAYLGVIGGLNFVILKES